MARPPVLGIRRRLVIVEVAGLYQLLRATIGSEGDIQILRGADLLRLSGRGGHDARIRRAMQRLHAIVVAKDGVELAGRGDRGGVG